MTTTKQLLSSVAVVALSAAAAPIAHAQDAGGQEIITMEEMVVTAQRRAQSIQDVPIAVSAFSQSDLDRLNINEALDLTFTIPNFIGHNNTGLGSANVYYIRGLGNTESIATFDPPVGTYIDDIFIQRQNANNFTLFEVERVEVLRGPQGTLFGRNTTGGAVRILLQPPADEWGGYAEAAYGRFNRLEFRGGFDAPVHDKIKLKVAGFYLEDDGFTENIITGETINGEESYGLRAAARIEPNEYITWDVSVSYLDQDHISVLNTPVDGDEVDPSALNNAVLAAVAGAGIDVGEPRVASFNISERNGSGPLLQQLLNGEGLGNVTETLMLTSNLKLDFDDISFEIITGYVDLNQDFIVPFFDGAVGVFGIAGSPVGGAFSIANEGDHRQFSQEIKANGSLFDGLVDYVAGFFYFEEINDTEFGQINIFNTFGGGGALDFNRILENDTRSYAGYAQFDVRPTDRLTLTVGVRYTEETKEIEVRHTTPAFAAAVIGPNTSTFNTQDLLDLGIPIEQSTNLVTPRFAVQYDVTDDVGVFVSATRGFKSGGWNARGVSPESMVPFAREIAWSYEAGARSQWFDNRLTANATAFYLDVGDFQIPSTVEGPGGTPVFITQNFADLEVVGLELEIAAMPVDNLNLFVNLGWQDASYRNLDPMVQAIQANCQTGLATGDTDLIDDNCGNGIITADGSVGDPVRTPDITLAFGGTYAIPVGDIGTILLTGVANYVDDSFTGTNNTPDSFTDSRFIVNAELALAGLLEDRLQLSVECSNCTGKDYVASALAGATYFDDPLTWSVRARYRY